ncbi:Glycerol-3-phosphate acyltransferase 1, mitochondrial [Papilio machaon]|uniref:Glycerol-3-phosphate acyltransferase 1, mitochondrial n=1 Tax=Papilio machaon TaxID=76193 RepID=A0A194RP33_PAPMA|nr:Glycerol-3-phosphate acyltransferase 1, mitochondrial [Papilio machaon]
MHEKRMNSDMTTDRDVWMRSKYFADITRVADMLEVVGERVGGWCGRDSSTSLRQAVRARRRQHNDVYSKLDAEIASRTSALYRVKEGPVVPPPQPPSRPPAGLACARCAPLSRVVKDERFQRAIDDTTQEEMRKSNGTKPDGVSQSSHRYTETRRKVEARAMKVLMDISSAMSNNVLRLVAWLCHKAIRRIAGGGCSTRFACVERLRRAKAAGLPLVFVPLHRSHFDYILVTFTLYLTGLRPPLVAAGDNMRIPFFGWILRGCGAFYIRRRVDGSEYHGDPIYKSALRAYILNSLGANNNLEFFIEGGRTRTGKPQPPKAGILSVIMDAYLDGTIDDALLVPVTLNYERLVDGSFVREQLGMPKQMETFWSALRGIWRTLNTNHGGIRVDFNQPISLKELVTSFQKYNYLKAPIERCLTPPNNNLAVNLDRQILYNHSHSSLYGADVSTDHKMMLEMLGRGVVRREGRQVRAQLTISAALELSYYANALVAHYAAPAILATALESIVCESDDDTVRHSELIESSLQLCEVLSQEFILCPPCTRIEETMLTAISTLVACDVLTEVQENNGLEEQRWSRRFARSLDDDEDDVLDQTRLIKYRVSKTSEAIAERRRLLLTIRPLLEAYSMTCRNVNNGSQKTVVTNTLEALTEEFTQNRMPYGEAVSTDAIRNCLKLLRQWGVIEMYSEGKERKLRIIPPYDNKTNWDHVCNNVYKFNMDTPLLSVTK